MTEFAIGRYGADDWRLMMWDGSTETEVAGPNSSVSGWASKPSLHEASAALMDYHDTGSSPFSSRQGAKDSLDLSNQWPIPVRDMTLTGETMPWND